MIKAASSSMAAIWIVAVLNAADSSSAFAAEASGPPNFELDPNSAWVPERGDNFLPPESGPGPVTVDRRFPLVQREGVQNTDRIADLANPILQPWAIERLKEQNDRVYAGKVPFVARERCWPGGVPGFLVYALFLPIRFFQTRTTVVIVDDLYGQVRHVYLNAPHSRIVQPSWHGESVGHWEGDELVVDTIGLNDRTSVDNFGTPHTDQLHVVERFKVDGAGVTLQATITVEDPGAFTTPWTAVQRWRRATDQPLVEHPCEASNVTFFGFDVAPIPQDDTPDF